MLIRIASRSSFLAKWQAYQVGRELVRLHPQIKIEYQFRESLGDKNLTDPLWKMPEKGVFTEDFYADLVEKRADLVVHSWKDLPTEEKEKTYIAATLKRADPRDLLLFKKTSVGKAQLNIFSSSPRRVYHVGPLLKWSLPFEFDAVEFTNVRGNIQTRIKKLLQMDHVDGLILAKAALDRLMDNSFYKAPDFLALQELLTGQLRHFNFQILPLSENPTAAAQGALAIEILRSRPELQELLRGLNHESDFMNCSEERMRLAEFGGGCHQKIGLTVVSAGSERVFFGSGLKPDNTVISHKGRLNSPTRKFAATDILVSDELWSGVERTALPSKHILEQVPVLITKKEVLQNITLKNTLNFTAGTETWKTLAKKGLWIHGSTDSLGNSQLQELATWTTSLMGLRSLSWHRLTHANSPAPAGDNSTQNIATYSIQLAPNLQLSLKNIKMIFWKSGYEFLRALEVWPELRQIEHACGMGQSAITIGSQAGGSKVTLYYNEQDWRNSVL